jgi:hypothetical protein
MHRIVPVILLTAALCAAQSSDTRAKAGDAGWVKMFNGRNLATVRISDKGNSGMYFRAQFGGPGWPKGYEAQVNSSHGDPVKTGSLYNIVKNFDPLVPPDTWFTQHIIADGNHITIKVNDKVIVDHVEDKNLHTKGYLALQQHDPGSTVMYKDLMFRRLPAK